MLSKSLVPAIGFICAALAVAPVAEAGCGHRHGGGGYSSYQSKPSGAYAAQLRAQRKAEARAAAARRAKIAAARAEKARIAKAEAAADAKKDAVKSAEVKSEPTKTETSSINTAKSGAGESKVDVAQAPTTCSKFVAAVGATVPVACDQK